MVQALILRARQEHRLRAVELMGIALIGVRSTGGSPAERALTRVIESVARRLLRIGDGGVKAALAAAQTLSELGADDEKPIEGLLGDLHAHCGISLLYGGEHGAAVAEFERALAGPVRPDVQVISLGGIALIEAFAGDIPASRRWVDAGSQRPWPDGPRSAYSSALLRLAQARVHLESGDLSQAEEALESVWHLIDTSEHWVLLAHMRALIDICRARRLRGSSGSAPTAVGAAQSCCIPRLECSR